MTVIGVSFKQYFGLADTLRWTRAAVRTWTDSGPLAGGPDAVELFVLPSHPLVSPVQALLAGTGIGVGAQDLAAADNPAQTGEVLGSLLHELGCRYAEVGHAERRRLFGEDEAVVAAKTAAALRHGLTPVLCLGEAERVPADVALAECRRQLDSALAHTRAAGLGGRLVVAYEPHWAIGAAHPAPEDHITTVCAGLRAAVTDLPTHPDSAVIYGGSAGPGLLTRLGSSVDGLFLGRFAHDPTALTTVLAEARHRDVEPDSAEVAS